MKKKRLSMNNIVEDNGKMYFLAFTSNSIYEMNKDMSACRVIKRIIDNSRGVQRGELPQHEGIYIYKNKIVILPDTIKRILVYDMNVDKIRYIEYPDSDYIYTPFFGGIIHNHYLYILPCTHNKVFKLDLECEHLYEINLGDVEINKVLNICAWGAVAFHDNKVVFTSMEGKKIFLLRLDSDSIEDVTPDGFHDDLAGVVCLDNRYWVFPKKCDRIIVLNNNFEVIYERYIDIDNYLCGDWSFFKFQVIDSYIYMLPRRANTFIRYSVEQDKFEAINISNISIKKNRLDKFMPISNVWKNNGDTYFAHSSSGKIFKIISGGIEECIIKVDTDYKISYVSMMVYENDEFDGLSDFLDSFC